MNLCAPPKVTPFTTAMTAYEAIPSKDQTILLTRPVGCGQTSLIRAELRRRVKGRYMCMLE